MNFRTILIIFNLLLIAGFVGFAIYRVVSLRRNPEGKQPENVKGIAASAHSIDPK